MPVRIGTRVSALALEQARLVLVALAARGVPAELVQFTTTGDQRLDAPLRGIGAKGLFTKELEVALADGAIDCAVHSLKDLPTESPAGLAVVAVLAREDPRDVVVVGPAVAAVGLAGLPAHARVGTSSLRRRAQLRALRPDLDVVELRGNVPTRLRKVDEGQVAAAILAAAGLHRLGAQARITAYLDTPGWLPAAGQGAIAVQARVADAALLSALGPLNDPATLTAVTAERAFLAALDGGCQVPIGAAVLGDTLYGMIADIDGRRVLRGQSPLDRADPAAAGVALADRLRGEGATDILRALRADQADLPAPQPE